MRERRNAFARASGAERLPLLHWMIFTGLSAFGFLLLWRFGLIGHMIEADRTYISSLIIVLYLIASTHCCLRLWSIAGEAEAARRIAALVTSGRGLTVKSDAVDVEGVGPLPNGHVATHIRDLLLKGELQGTRAFDQTLLLRGLANRLRGSNGLGAFAGDTLMKLGLVGTIIGFIMMLAPIGAIDMGNRGAVQSALGVMSQGMAVAMYTTLAGLVGSILLRLQYYFLDNATSGLFAFAVQFVEVHLVATPAAPPKAIADRMPPPIVAPARLAARDGTS